MQEVVIKNFSGTIQELYEKVQREVGVPGDVKFNCTKISCAESIANAIFKHYEDDGVPKDQSAMWWLCYGPKCDPDLPLDTVVIEDDFFETDEG